MNQEPRRQEPEKDQKPEPKSQTESSPVWDLRFRYLALLWFLASWSLVLCPRLASSHPRPQQIQMPLKAVLHVAVDVRQHADVARGDDPAARKLAVRIGEHAVEFAECFLERFELLVE